MTKTTKVYNVTNSAIWLHRGTPVNANGEADLEAWALMLDTTRFHIQEGSLSLSPPVTVTETLEELPVPLEAVISTKRLKRSRG